MRGRIARAGLIAGVVVAFSTFTAPAANAWGCIGVTQPLCFVVGTSCNVFDDVTGHGHICQLG